MRVADGLMQETPKSLILLRFTTEPRTGRFITRDSYTGERENADTWHLYAYCANNPINYVKKGLKTGGKLKKLTIKVPTIIDELKKESI